jgi:hypothetical protein
VQFDRPEGWLPELPHDITTVSDRDLMVLMRQFAEWQNFMDTLFVSAEEAEAEAAANLELKEAHALISAEAKEVTKARAFARQHPEVMIASAQASDAKATRKALSMKINNLDRLAFIVSRELTRRLGRAPQEGRVSRYGGA